MSRTSVQVQKPLAIPDLTYGAGALAVLREVGRRRIFVQTDTGNVLGLELDRSETVQALKKKVQAVLHVPTEQSALVFGDHVIEDDLREVRNDSPLLLTRGLHRSSSSPCLSPTSLDFSEDNWSQPLEVVAGSGCSKIKPLINESLEALENGIDPILASGGLGGAYYFRNSDGESVAIVKPTDEEPFAPNNPKGFVGKVLGQPGLKRSIRVGETGIREVAAYLLDHDHFAGVPPTALVKAVHSVFNVNKNNVNTISGTFQGDCPAKLASFQQFVKHDCDANEIGPSRFPVSAVHKIGILDIRILNTDRHAGNILIRKFKEDGRPGVYMPESVELIPIDHGLCLPEFLEDPYFEWLHWPQASMPFSEEEVAYIGNLDPYEDAELLRKELPMLREGSLRVLVLCTLFLKKAVRAGLSLGNIGSMMSRELDEAESEFEKICTLAKLQVDEHILAEADELDEHEIHFHLDMDQQESPKRHFGKPCLSPRAAFSRCFSLQDRHLLEEEVNEQDTTDGKCAIAENVHYVGMPRHTDYKHNWTNQSHLRRFITMPATRGSRRLSNAEGITGDAKPLMLSEMTEDVWGLFVSYFEDQLELVLGSCKSENVTRVHKLGTSCMF